MNNFTHWIPTRIHFGKGQISRLTELSESGSRVLLVYGGGSIRESGLYDEIRKILTGAGLSVTELSGIEPNPKIESVRRGTALCREHRIDMVLAVGGGSVIDAAKIIAAGAVYNRDAWDLVLNESKIVCALPVYCVLTMSATGSEMNPNAVISDRSLHLKVPTHSDHLRPVMSVCDPTYTFSVSRLQTAAGTADIMSHTMENYFTNAEGAYLQARFCEAILKTCIHCGPAALETPDDYDARANLMWASAHAINGLVKGGAEVPWSVHPMEHELSAFYDITHGVGLAILTPRWMRHILSEKTAPQFAEYGRNVWDLPAGSGDRTAALQAIEKTEHFFFDVLGLPKTLTEVGIGEEHFDIMAAKAASACRNTFVPLAKEDILAIFRASL